MGRGLSNDNLRLLSTAGANEVSYGYLLSLLRPPGSHALELFTALSLFGEGLLDLGEEEELRGLSQEELEARVVRVTPWGWEYLRSQGLEVKAGPEEGDGPSNTRFPPDIPPVVSHHIHEIQINPEKGRIFRLSECMTTLRELHPHYNLKKRALYKKKIENILKVLARREVIRVVREGKPGAPGEHTEVLWTTCPPDEEPKPWERAAVEAREGAEHEERLAKRALGRRLRAMEAAVAPVADPATMGMGPGGEQAPGLDVEVPPEEENVYGAVFWQEGGLQDFFGGGEELVGEAGEGDEVQGGGGEEGED